MARTGERAAELRRLLERAGLTSLGLRPVRPSGVAHEAELLDLYRDLGGLLASPVWRPGSWDLVFDGMLVVELDEQLHFNRYRALTLGASWAGALPWSDPYGRYCIEHENACMRDGRWGKRWTNSSCRRMFAGGPVGDLDGHGAPRWKQRAFYDALKDSGAGTEIDFAVARVAIYDTVDGVLLDDVLEQRAQADPSAVMALVESRTVSAPRPR